MNCLEGFRFISAWGVLFTFLLAACSDTSVSDETERGMGIVATVDELPSCTAENEGESFFVKSESGMRLCTDGKWFAIMDGSAMACHTEELLDKSGLKIICGNDSVGVVLNGAKGDNGLSGQGCSVTKKSADSLWVKCGASTFAMPFTNSDVLDSEKIATSLEGVGGFTQKGPFLMGSEVNVIELRDGRTLDQTGDNFETVILNDSGFFKLNARMMMSQYLELHAKGYYRNEVSGKNSNAPLTLYALTDVMMREGGLVNINLLTHLEYHRVVHLVKQQKMRVAAAKDSAEREIFALLDIDAKNFANSEDLNIAGSSEGDAALLAFSIMLQGDRDVARLSVLLTNISADMEKDGVWNDTTMRDSIADWAQNADETGRLDTIRSHVESWGLSAKVPNFEKYVRHFWTSAYGLGKCGKDSHDTVVAATPKRFKNSLDRYICVDSAGIGYMWRKAKDVEKDTYLWKAAADGTMRDGDVTKAKYIYDAVEGSWRTPSINEMTFGACTEAFEVDSAGSVKRNAFYGQTFEEPIYNTTDLYVKCENRQWVESDAYYADTRKYPVPAAENAARRGDYTGNTYVYDKTKGFWRVGWATEYELGSGCSLVNRGSISFLATRNEYYICKPDSMLVVYPGSIVYVAWQPDEVNDISTSDVHWIKTPYRWIKDETSLSENVYGNPCDSDGKWAQGRVSSHLYYVCDDYLWRDATEMEKVYQRGCTKAAHFVMDTMSCVNGTIRATRVYDYDVNVMPDNFFNSNMETFQDTRDGRWYKKVKIGRQTWMAQNLNFKGNADYPYVEPYSWCYGNDTTSCLKVGRLYAYKGAMNYSSGEIDESNHQGACPNGWRIPSEDDWNELLSSFGSAVSAANALGAVYYRFPDATNSSGFTALPTGAFSPSVSPYGGYLYSLMNDNIDAVFWHTSRSAYVAGIVSKTGAMQLIVDAKAYLQLSNVMDPGVYLPVRCIENTPAGN